MLAGLRLSMRSFFLNKELIVVTFQAIRPIRVVEQAWDGTRFVTLTTPSRSLSRQTQCDQS